MSKMVDSPKKTEKKERCEFCNGAGIFEKEGYETVECFHCEGTGLEEASGGEKESSVRVGFESPLSEKDEIATNSKLPEHSCKTCKHESFHGGQKIREDIRCFTVTGLSHHLDYYEPKEKTDYMTNLTKGQATTEPEKVREPALNCFDCSEQIKHESEIKELIEGFIKFIDHFEEHYEGKKCGECLEYWKTIKERYKGV